MGWLPFADTALPVGDIIYFGVFLLLGAVALFSDQDYVPEISYDAADVAHGPPPNDDDDDDDDDDYDYYDDDSNFGGRQKIGGCKGNAPGNNQAQNKQARSARRGVPIQKRRLIHELITGQGYGYHEIMEIVNQFKK